MEKKNSAIELWRYIFTIGIAIGHLNQIIWNKNDVNLLFTGSKFLAFFMFLSGYFLMANYKKNKENKAPSVNAWNYTKKRINALYPALFSGVLLAFVIRNVVAKTPFNELLTIFMNSIFEFLGISQLSMNFSTLWNSPLWYISALFVVGYILYYIVSKSEDLFRFIAVLFIIWVYGILHLSATSADGVVLVGMVPANMLILMAGMMLGMLMYYIVDYFKKKKFTENVTMIMSILHITLAMLILYFWVHNASWNNEVYDLILFVFTTILLINKDYISVLYNDSVALNLLGRLSLYFYVSHIGFIYLLAYLFPEMPYVPSIIFNISFSTCWAFILLYIDDYFVTPVFRKNKKEVKKLPKKVKKVA